MGPYLPLFLLNAVHYPFTLLPLHVFEERYRELVAACLEGDQTLGIVLIRSGWEVGGPAVPWPIGTRARIIRADRLADGRYQLLVRGEGRFRIERSDYEAPYLRAEVAPLAETVGQKEAAAALSEVAGPLLLRYWRLLLDAGTARSGGEAARRLWEASPKELPREPVPLSYLAAAALPADLLEKQRLLELPSAEARLRRIVPRLSAVVAALQKRRLGRIENGGGEPEASEPVH